MTQTFGTISRRRVLLAGSGLANVALVRIAVGGVAVGGLVAGCADATPSSDGSPHPSPPELELVAAAETSLIALYDATIAAFPVLASGLTPLRDQHVDHRAAVGGAPDPAPAPAVASSATGALAALRDAERQAARDRRASCLAAGDEAAARLLALIAASEASHLPVLRQLERT